MVADIDIYQSSIILTGLGNPERRNFSRNSLSDNKTELLNQIKLPKTLNEKN
jgi:hypothetical protein